jgi:hypothetical protein
MAFVYWIHKPEDKNMFTEGYVGFTSKTVQSRYKTHGALVKSGSIYPIHCAIRKYGDSLVIETLIEGSSEYCLDMERELRPSPNIGWNISIGGGAPMLGMKHTDELKEKLRQLNTGKVMSPEAIKASSEKRTGARRTPEMVLASKLRAAVQFSEYKNEWDHPHSNKKSWLLAQSIYDIYKTGCVFGRRSVAKKFDVGPDSAMKVVNKIKSGWNPSLDTDWLDFKNKQGVK